MSPRRTILVLEDAHERIDWLRSVFALAGFTIDAHADVAPFLAAAKAKHAELALVIFDHDLGAKSEDPPESGVFFATVDSEGKTGADAARHIVALDCPALVWSWNPEGGRTIGRTLHAEKKATRVYLGPFSTTPQYAAFVASMIEGERLGGSRVESSSNEQVERLGQLAEGRSPNRA